MKNVIGLHPDFTPLKNIKNYLVFSAQAMNEN